MGRYFFHFRQGRSYSLDETGAEFDSVEAAFLGAFRAAQEMWGELLIARQDPLACSFEIADAQGHELMVLPFAEILESCRDGAVPVRQWGSSVAFAEAIAGRRRAMALQSQVTTLLHEARTNLRETVGLLASVTRAAAE